MRSALPVITSNTTAWRCNRTAHKKCRLQVLLAVPAYIDGSAVGDHIRPDDMALRPRRSQER